MPSGAIRAPGCDNGPVLLRQASEVQDSGEFAVEVSRRAQQGAERQNPQSSDASHVNVEPLVRQGPASGRWKRREAEGFNGLKPLAVGFTELDAFNFDEAWAKSLYAGIVLVAARLIDLSLAPEWRFQRLNRDAVRLDRTVTAFFADARVDEQASVGIGIVSTLAA